MTRWKLTKKFIPLFAMFLLIFTGCSSLQDPGPLNPKGSVGKEQLWLINFSLAIMIVVMVVVFALFFYVVIRYRKRKGQTGIPKQIEGNHKLELLWTIIPLLLLFALAIPTIMTTFNLAEEYNDPEEAIQVKVVGHQFWWEFEYPDYGIITAQELVIPVGKKVQYELTTTDVNHSFWIPALGGKMDNTAGLTNRFYLEADEPGTYQGRCAELCGLGHALMNFNVKAVSEADFDAWTEQMQPTEISVPQELEKAQAIYTAKCIGCHAIDTGSMGLGPNLSGFANRDYVAGFLANEDSEIRRWLTNPEEVKQGTLMPQIPLTDDEMNELIKYLNNLK